MEVSKLGSAYIKEELAEYMAAERKTVVVQEVYHIPWLPKYRTRMLS